MPALSEFRSPTPAHDGSTWVAGHFYSGRDPGTALFVSSANGRPHLGFDQAAPSGSSIVAPADGVVAHIDFNDGAGHWIAIAHDVGGRTLFSRHLHCLPQFLVGEGDPVTAGSPIAQVGSTGASDAPHNHTELIWDKPQANWTEDLHIDPEYVYFGRTPGNQIGGPTVIQGLQQALADAGFDPGPIDGKWGSTTQQALTNALTRGPAAEAPPSGVVPEHRHENRFAKRTGGVVR